MPVGVVLSRPGSKPPAESRKASRSATGGRRWVAPVEGTESAPNLNRVQTAQDLAIALFTLRDGRTYRELKAALPMAVRADAPSESAVSDLVNKGRCRR